MSVSRRSFLKRAAASAAAAPFILPSHVWAAETKPNSRLTMGFIGMGTQNRGPAWAGSSGRTRRCWPSATWTPLAATTPRSAWTSTTPSRPGRSGQCAAYNDFREIIDRKDIDAVCIATPDHWHAIITLAALRGRQGRLLREAADAQHPRGGRGDAGGRRQQARAANRLDAAVDRRSSASPASWCATAPSARSQRVECSFGDPAVPCDLPEEPMEPGLDWNLWVGPAPMRPYNSVLSPRGVHKHFPNWRGYREFGGGMVTDWGAHHLDIAQWGLGMDDSGPVEVLPPEKPDAKRGAKLVYANGVTVEHKDGFGVHFFGTEGRSPGQPRPVRLQARQRDDRLLHRHDGQEDLLRGGGAEGGAGVPQGRRRSSSTSARTTSAISWTA